MPDLVDSLSTLLGPSRVSVRADDLAAHATDKWFAAEQPSVVVSPESTEEVSELLRWAEAERVPVTPQGARVGYVGGAVPAHRGIALNLLRMNRLLELNLADGVAVVQPGLITAELQAAARQQGWFYPPDPASLKECSLGGNIATNAGGPRCLKYGVTRHYVLGLEAVLAGGSVVRGGGRCHKNKTGFDLVGLMVGSEGMLGVVTEATLRLIPHPPMRCMISAGFRTFPEVAHAVQTILNCGFLPSALEIADAFTLRAARQYLGESVTPEGDAHLLVELDGQADTLPIEAGHVAQLIADLGAVRVEQAHGEEASERFWQLRREFSYSLRATGLIKLNEDIVVPRGRLVDLVEFASTLQAEFDFPVACFGHAGDGNIHVNIMVPTMEDGPVRERAEAALDRLFLQVIAWNGAITGEHGVGLAKKRWWRHAVSPATHAAHLALKQALDPHHILNPGKFLD
ncbi:MAG: FAD-binding protein [Verrucomicrobiales bacterium]|nr:FAD-binding protein [Verrucomicrobiales bacterium]